MIAHPILFAAVLAFANVCTAATLEVNTLEDDTPAGDGLVSLREALVAAGSDTITDLGQSGSGADTLHIGVAGGIALQSLLPVIDTDVGIVGTGSALTTIDATGVAGGPPRLFLVDHGGRLRLSDLRLSGATVAGFDGGTCEQRSGGGGGGAALGGLVLVHAGDLVAERVRFDDGHVIGGYGGSRTLSTNNFGGGGGGGFGSDGGVPLPTIGGTGGSPAPLSPGPGAAPAQNGVPGGGGGGGNYTTDPALMIGGAGGFGAGGGGGGNSLFFAAAAGGAGGFGGGGGGRGGGDGDDGPGAAGGAFAGAGGASTGNGNISGGGGGGAGLGGCVFVYSGSVEIANSSFHNCSAHHGLGGNNSGMNDAANGQGRGGAIFIAASTAYAVLAGISFTGSVASSAGGSGYTPGTLSDTADVYGTVARGLFVDGFE